jgi:hypothetical protein
MSDPYDRERMSKPQQSGKTTLALQIAEAEIIRLRSLLPKVALLEQTAKYVEELSEEYTSYPGPSMTDKRRAEVLKEANVISVCALNLRLAAAKIKESTK